MADTTNLGLKKFSYADDFDTKVLNDNWDKVDANCVKVEPNAGSHNAIYRGKQLCPTGQGPTAAQYKAISDGTFEDLFVGDYWTLGNNDNELGGIPINWRIAGFDYFLGCGWNPKMQTHHAVLVPDVALYNAKMNENDTTNGGYVGSLMYNSGLNRAKKMIGTSDTTDGDRFFKGHVINHRRVFSTGVNNGIVTNVMWCESEVNLMTQQMLCGSALQTYALDGTAKNVLVTESKSQLPLFSCRPDLIQPAQSYWLQDVASATGFAWVTNNGVIEVWPASTNTGVRPCFCIGGAA